MMQFDLTDSRFNMMIGQLSAVESAVMFVMRCEFERAPDPRAAAAKWFDTSIAVAGRTDHSIKLATEHEQQGAQAVLTELHRELIRMKVQVLAAING